MASKVMFVLAAIVVFQVVYTNGDTLHDFNTEASADAPGFQECLERKTNIDADVGILLAETKALANILDAGLSNPILVADVKNKVSALAAKGPVFLDFDEEQISRGRDLVESMKALLKQFESA